MAGKKRVSETERDETVTAVSVRLTEDESGRLEWAARKLGYRGVGAMLRSVGLEKELELRKLGDKHE